MAKKATKTAPAPKKAAPKAAPAAPKATAMDDWVTFGSLPPRKQTSPAVSSLASRVLSEPIDQAMWNRIRNDEQAFYIFAGERKTLAASALAQDETPG
jgi:hypothetical protein